MKDDRIRQAKAAQHAQAFYWNGPLTRAEAQKVFDETAGVIKHLNETIIKLDMCVAFLVEKSGATKEEIQAWMDARLAKMKAEMEANNAVEAQPPAPPADGAVPQADGESTPLVTLD